MTGPAAGSLPTARIEPLRERSWAWVLPLSALALVLWLASRVWAERGPRITVHAPDGHGLRAGDLVRYRGIAVGEVASARLSGDLAEVVLDVRLERSSAGLARAGSRFWIVRPSLGLEGAQGLETILGSRYLAVLPGPPEAAPQREFVALAEPPLPGVEEEGGLEIVLEARQRSALSRGAPLLYRGMQIGAVTSVGLAGDATAVEVRARVRPAYAELVRTDSRFWELGGAEFSLGLSGLDVELGSLRSLLSGGIALATPTHPGARVSAGHRFPLAKDAEEDWLDWRPALPLGSALLPPGTLLPELVRVRLVWKSGRFLSRERSRSGWALPVEEGLLGPTDLLVPPEGAEEGSVALELRGERVPLRGEPDGGTGNLSWRRVDLPEVAPCPDQAQRALSTPEDCLAVGDPAGAPVAIAAARLTEVEGRWRIDPALSFDASWHGAAVLARADGALVGLLLVEDGRGTVAGLPPR